MSELTAKSNTSIESGASNKGMSIIVKRQPQTMRRTVRKGEDRYQKPSMVVSLGLRGEPQQKKQRKDEEPTEKATTHAGLNREPQKQKQNKGEEKALREGAINKPYAIFYTDDDEEPPIAEQIQTQDEVIQKLRADLEQAQGKVVLLASTLEKIHRTANSLAERLRSGVRLMKKAATLLGAEKGKELITFASENTAVVRAIMDPMNEASERLDSAFPAMAQRVFLHEANEPTDGMKNWIEASATSYEKLKDDMDKAVDSQGKQC